MGVMPQQGGMPSMGQQQAMLGGSVMNKGNMGGSSAGGPGMKVGGGDVGSGGAAFDFVKDAFK